MRLNRLRLQNFRQHADTTVVLDLGLTGIIGPNGAGKTTLMKKVAERIRGVRAAGFITEMREEYDMRRRYALGRLQRIKNFSVVEPRGAFYAFPSVKRTGMDDNTFAERLLQEEQVAVVPGSAFGVGGDGYVRMAYATAYEKIEQALERIHRFMQRHG